MKNIILLLLISFLIGEGFAQHKTMTVYYSGGTTDVVNLTNTDSIVIFICGASKVNYVGKDYNTVVIGSQCWFKENLDAGTLITSWPANNGIIEKYCYNNVLDSCTIYGGLYMWHEAMQYVTTEGAKGICPAGWHMPKESEFQALINFVDSNANVLKREDQGSGSGQGTNTSGFSELLAGAKAYSGGPFQWLGIKGSFYAGKIGSCGSCALAMNVVYDTSIIYFGDALTSWGCSVRCIKDE